VFEALRAMPPAAWLGVAATVIVAALASSALRRRPQDAT
jgi:hypothetical protein